MLSKSKPRQFLKPRVLAMAILVSTTTLGISLLNLADTSRAWEGWSIEIVDTAGGYSSSLQLDSAGNAHISYNGGLLGLRYARQTATGWQIETVDLRGSYTSLGLDSNDWPNIAYYDSVNDDLKFAKWSGTSWSIEAVDLEGDVGRYASMALDSFDRPHIGYHRDEDAVGNKVFDLKYAKWDGSQWTAEIVEAQGDVGFWTSLALDDLDRPHISYVQSQTWDVKYARWNGIQWDIQIVDSQGDLGYETSLFLDSMNRPHVSYMEVIDDNNVHLKYAYWNGMFWLNETVDSSVKVGEFCSLALDSLDRPSIAYFSVTGSELRYAQWTGSQWAIETVDSLSHTGEDPFLVLDSLDVPHISYAFGASQDLRYAVASNVPLPDLKVAPSDIVVIPPSPTPNGTMVSINATIHNLGRENVSSVLVRFYDGQPASGVQIGPDQFTGMIYSSGGIQNVSVSWIAAPPGTHQICAVVDPDDEINEMSENNNEACISYEVVLPSFPDLTLSPPDIVFDRSPPFPNSTFVVINVTIHNIGSSDAADVSVRFLDNPYGQIQGDKVIPTVTVGESGSAEATWNATPIGSHEICVWADPENEIEESDEGNNEACVLVDVAEGSIPSPPSGLNAQLSGGMLENITLLWDISPDDGAGLNNVVTYDIHRGTVYDPGGQSYLLHATVPAGTSSFADIGVGEGNPIDYFYRVCAVNSVNLSSCTLGQAGKFTHPLAPGPSLVSIPLTQSNESMESVLQTVDHDKAWFYDSFSKEWNWYMKYKTYSRGLLNVNHTMGLWINVTEYSNLTIAGVVPSQTVIYLYEGWNLVSFPSFNTSYIVANLKVEVGATRVEGYDSITPYYLRLIG
ncbi:MAG: hypothetical protein KAW09_08295, partial [Thermoplasmata archaeon]|nr:hypothetical protein [Thermoplasmata archaeon]